MDEPEPEECWHEEFEADINGLATCGRCGARWWMTVTEIAREGELRTDYDKMIRRAERRERIERWLHALAFWRRWRKPAPIDDEVPF